MSFRESVLFRERECEGEVLEIENSKDWASEILSEEEKFVKEITLVDSRERGETEGMEDIVEENGEEEVLGSSLTMEKVAAAKQFIENHYRAQMKNIQERKERYLSLSLSLSHTHIHTLTLLAIDWLEFAMLNDI